MFIFYILLIIVLAFSIDRIGLYFERKGWLYYRKRKPQTGIIGSALQELNAQLLPSNRHVIAAKQEQIFCQKNESEMTNQFANKIKTAYDKIAKIWHEKRDWHIEKPSIDELIAHLKSDAKILDVGCGSGKPLAAYLLNQGFNVYGVDISPKQIEYARQIISEKKLFIADICDFSTELRFDAIVCWFTLFHLHANLHEFVLNKLNSLLKSNGLLLICFADTSVKPEAEFKQIDEYTIESEMFGERFYHSGVPAKENTQRIKKAGFSILSDKIDQPGNQVILAKKIPL